jgi:hypothetical protein
MMSFVRAAVAAAVLVLAAGSPAAAQHAALAPVYDARLVPPPARAAEPVRLHAAALPPRAKGAGMVLLGAGLMYVTKQMEGEDGEDGVPFLPLLSGTMGALTFWYGVYTLVQGDDS